MADSDFWRDLAVSFRAISDPMGILTAKWTNFEQQPRWELVRGDFITLSAQFEPLARRGGWKLDSTRDSLEVWLDAMRFEEGYVLEERTKVETGEVIACLIPALCQRSADFCNLLESRALESERIAAEKEREQNNPRNWSPLAQQWEALKVINKLQGGPREEIPEVFVREVLAREHGIKPEEVSWDQIRSELHRLPYRAVRVIPSSDSHLESNVQSAEVTNMVATREQRLQDFVSNKKASIADVGRTANVFKANIQQWRRGELSEDSVMSQRIEGVLAGRTPLVRKGKKKG